MKNYWKRFVASVTELRNDPFADARIKLTILYTVSILVVFALLNLVLAKVDGGMVPHHYGLNNWTLNLYFFISLGVIFISLFIGSITLSPIKRVMLAQKRFIADASHELRTPLAIMKTNSEVALMNEPDVTEVTATLKSNLEENDRMSKIIENLLSLSYYDNKFAEIPFSPINLATIVQNIAEKARNLAKKKAVTLKVQNADSCYIMGNTTAIEQLAINLIKNSVTYTSAGGEVCIWVTNTDSGAEFKVKDNGIGIAEQDLQHIFKPFYKAGKFRSQAERESSGLGLTIVRKIVERHKGIIYVNSKLGKGTTISITFPVIEAPVA